MTNLRRQHSQESLSIKPHISFILHVSRGSTTRVDANTNKMESRYSRYILETCNTPVLNKSGFSAVQMGLPSEQGDTKDTENTPSFKRTTAETLVRSANTRDRFESKTRSIIMFVLKKEPEVNHASSPSTVREDEEKASLF